MRNPSLTSAFLLFFCLLVWLPAKAANSTPQALLFEAEEFSIIKPGWQAQKYGANYYVGTFANTFLSRKAFLGAPEQCPRSVASLKVEIPSSGRYLALVRYEAAYRFETQ